MKTLLTIFTLVFTLMFSSTSFAGWTKVSENSAATFYVDFDRIRKVDGYVYWWRLDDYLEPDERGIMSLKTYYKGDCGQNGIISLALIKFEQPMGEGKGETVDLSPIKLEWEFDRIGSGDMGLSYVCDYFN